MPYAVLRIYNNAPGLADTVAARQDEVRSLLTSIQGFRSWGMIRTGANSAVSVTVCDDKTGCDESIRIAAEWVKANVSAEIAPPTVLQGETVGQRISVESVPA